MPPDNTCIAIMEGPFKRTILYRLLFVLVIAVLAAFFLRKFPLEYYQQKWGKKSKPADIRVEEIFGSLFKILEEAEEGAREPDAPPVRKTWRYLSEVTGIEPEINDPGEGLRLWKAWYQENCGYLDYDGEKQTITCPLLKRSVPAPGFLPEDTEVYP